MEHELSRIGVSLPENLLERFDEVITKRGYSSRSEGIRDAIRGYIRYYEWMSEVDGERAGVLSITYDSSQRRLFNSFLDIENEFSDITRSAVHVNLSRDEYMKVLILCGEGKKLVALAEHMLRLKGVLHVKLTTIKPEEEISARSKIAKNDNARDKRI